MTTGTKVKVRIEDLAIFGGTSAFSEPLHVGRPNIGDRKRFLERVTDILDRNWLTNDGPYVQEFERRIAEFAGVRHCVAMCNATIALEIAIRALGLTGEVIVPSFTFAATAHALQWQEITPVFCDIDPKTHTIDPDKVERQITPRTTGIIGVHVWGRPCDIDRLEEIARLRNLRLLFDAAHAFGCSYKGKRIGGFGRCEILSFHATKFCNSFEGGAILTNDKELAEKTRLMRNFGFSGYDNVIYIGINGKMTEPCAAMGLTSMESIPHFVEINRRNHASYRRELSGIAGLKLIEYDELEESNYQYVVLEVDAEEAGLTRDDLVAVLTPEKILARRYFYPGCHRMEPYRSLSPNASDELRETERLCQRVLILPTGTAVSCDEINTICQVLRTALTNAQAVSDCLRLDTGRTKTLSGTIGEATVSEISELSSL